MLRSGELLGWPSLSCNVPFCWRKQPCIGDRTAYSYPYTVSELAFLQKLLPGTNLLWSFPASDPSEIWRACPISLTLHWSLAVWNIPSSVGLLRTTAPSFLARERGAPELHSSGRDYSSSSRLLMLFTCKQLFPLPFCSVNPGKTTVMPCVTC